MKKLKSLIKDLFTRGEDEETAKKSLSELIDGLHHLTDPNCSTAYAFTGLWSVNNRKRGYALSLRGDRGVCLQYTVHYVLGPVEQFGLDISHNQEGVVNTSALLKKRDENKPHITTAEGKVLPFFEKEVAGDRSAQEVYKGIIYVNNHLKERGLLYLTEDYFPSS